MEHALNAWLDQEDSRTKDAIRTYRWMIQYVGGPTCSVPGCGDSRSHDGPAFAYTIGLHGMGHPEFLLFGLDPESAQEVLNWLGSQVLDGRHFLPGERIEDPVGHPITIEEVPNPEEILFAANRFYRLRNGSTVSALQVTYSDCQGRYPWEEGCDRDYVEAQPRPGEFRA